MFHSTIDVYIAVAILEINVWKRIVAILKLMFQKTFVAILKLMSEKRLLLSWN